jgi:hypothetical protein
LDLVPENRWLQIKRDIPRWRRQRLTEIKLDGAQETPTVTQPENPMFFLQDLNVSGWFRSLQQQQRLPISEAKRLEQFMRNEEIVVEVIAAN